MSVISNTIPGSRPQSTNLEKTTIQKNTTATSNGSEASAKSNSTEGIGHQNPVTDSMITSAQNVAEVNIEASKTDIRDVNNARKAIDEVKNSILTHHNEAILAQSNVDPKSVLELLG